MLLVIGGNGQVGSAVLKHLTAQGIGVRSLMRDPAHPRVAAPTIEPIQGDLANVESLKRPLEGVRTAFLTSTYEPRMAELQRNFVRAAETAGVEHIVQLTGQGADPRSPVRTLRWLGEVEQALADSRIFTTRLRAATFMQNLLASSADIAAGVLSAPFGDRPVTFVDTRDIGAAAARAMLRAGHQGADYGVSGPASLPYTAVADEFARVLGHPVAYRAVSLQEARGGLEAAGIPAVMVEALIELWDFLASGALASPVTDTVLRLTGRAPRPLAAFIADHASAFAAPPARAV